MFSYPAYISVYDEEVGQMEYALIDEENKKIIYLYSRLNADIENKIDKCYLPANQKDMKNEVLRKGYNIYLFDGEIIK